MRTKQELAARLEELQYPWEQFTVEHFIEYVGTEVRNRRINVVPMPNLPLPWCVSGPTMDFIFYSASINPMLQNHHKLHEVGHFIFDHVQTIEYVETENLIEIIGRFYGRFRTAIATDDVKVNQEENEAEYLVYLIHNQLHAYKRFHELLSIAHRRNLFIPPFNGKFSKTEE